eukprot:gnl/Spiro4/21664_TR10614_c0_g1_i1.p1 gnl/Spiro4/21664_TR10614_c0_g1~~gnl/Spiro4/21664_TR10614_c0_g1_i1.p1  ORF type:complete len:167 (-),score=11.79 gnl/Spiro4/21664_TR10614_c0_g1_i1:30-476(-)
MEDNFSAPSSKSLSFKSVQSPQKSSTVFSGMTPVSNSPISSQSKEGVEKIVLLQKAAGFWALSDATSFIPTKQENIKEKNPAKDKPNSEELWVTALVIAWLNLKFQSSRDIWELVESKGKKYIKKLQIKNNLKDVDFLSLAEEFAKTI